MLLLGKIMILQGVGHPISCLGVCYANDPKKGGYMTPAPALDLTTSLRGDLWNEEQVKMLGCPLVAPILFFDKCLWSRRDEVGSSVWLNESTLCRPDGNV